MFTAEPHVPLPASFLKELAQAIGSHSVLSHPHDLRVYECDAYTIEKSTPQVVVLPKSTAEVATVVRLCAKYLIPIIPRGAGTSLSGTVLATRGGVVLGLSRMTKIESVDVINRRALVQAGCINAWITNAVKSHGLLYAPDPSSQTACTIGGNVGTNSGGPHTLKYGVTTNHVLGYELVLPNGEIVWLGVTPEGGENAGGLDLRGAALGTEGMTGVVTRVLVRLVRAPAAYSTMLAVFDTVDDASEAVSSIIRAGIVPAAIEMMDQLITNAVEKAFHFGFPLDAGAVLIVELDGPAAGLIRQTEQVQSLCLKNHAREVRLAKDQTERLELWKSRKRAFGAIGRLSPSFITQDGVVPRSQLPAMMRFIAEVSDRVGLRIPNVFHAGDGNLHPLILFDERDPSQVQKAIEASDQILTHCLRLGGSVSGEHGIGIEKIDFMARQFTPDDLEAMQRFRQVFDPEMRSNPDKMFPTGSRCLDFLPKRKSA